MALYRKNNFYVGSLIIECFMLLLVFLLLALLWFIVTDKIIHQNEANISRLSNEELLIQAEKGNTSAQNQLSRNLLELGGTSEGQRGIQWLHQAAEGGNAEAQYDLVISYEHINHIMRDNPVRGMAYLRAAAEQNHLRSMAVLAAALEKGQYGMRQDYQMAHSWYRKILQAYESGEYQGTVDEQFITTQRRQFEFVTNVLNYNRGILRRYEKATPLDRKIIEIDNRYRQQYQKAAKALDHGDNSLEGRKRFRAEVNRLRQQYVERRKAEIEKLKVQLAAESN